MSEDLPTPPKKPVPPTPPKRPVPPTPPERPVPPAMPKNLPSDAEPKTATQAIQQASVSRIGANAMVNASRMEGVKIAKPTSTASKPTLKKAEPHKPALAQGKRKKTTAPRGKKGTQNSTRGKKLAKDLAYGIYDILFYRVKLFLLPFLGIDWIERKRWRMWCLHLFLSLVIAPLIGYSMGGLLYALIGCYFTGLVLEIIADFSDFDD